MKVSSEFLGEWREKRKEIQLLDNISEILTINHYLYGWNFDQHVIDKIKKRKIRELDKITMKYYNLIPLT